nr:hypothetical protein Iba_chr04dCG14700 [Ipomoea batatas]
MAVAGIFVGIGTVSLHISFQFAFYGDFSSVHLLQLFYLHKTFNPVSGHTSVRMIDDGVAAPELAAGGVQVPADGRGAHQSLSEAENQRL